MQQHMQQAVAAVVWICFIWFLSLREMGCGVKATGCGIFAPGLTAGVDWQALQVWSERMQMRFLAAAMVVAGSMSARGQSVTVQLVGDSTMTESAGYGTGFCASFTPEVKCVDSAKGGASTKTYRAQGLWEKALAVHADWMLIQLGHNDVTAPDKPPMERNTTIEEFTANMRRFVNEARANGAHVVLVTPLARRYFQPDGTIKDDLDAHAAIVVALAKELNVPLIDLHEESRAFLEKAGPAVQEKYGRTKEEDGKTLPDKTHLNEAGSMVFGRMVAVDLARVAPGLQKYVKPSGNAMPARPRKIVLVGDSTTAVQGGWGPGFCADVAPRVRCVDTALNGRSTKSFIDEGAWAKALAERGTLYTIQFGHNDEKSDPARHTDPETTFAENLRRMVRDVKAQGGDVVLLSPLARRTFVDGKPSNADLRAYGDAAKRVASEEHVAYLDLLTLSEARLAQGTQADADAFDATAHADAKAENSDKAKPSLDRTHLNEAGKRVFGDIVAKELARLHPEFAAVITVR